MKKLLAGVLAAGLIAASVPGAAVAQSRDHDGRWPAQGQRDDNRGAPSSHRPDNRFQQAAPRQAQRRDDGRRQWEGERIRADRYQPPRGYREHQWRKGEKLPATYRGRNYVVDYQRYHLAPPPRGYQYVRVNDDVVLAAVASGLISSVIMGLLSN